MRTIVKTIFQRLIYIPLLLGITTLALHAQQSTNISVGSWRSHGSFNILKLIANDGNTIYTSSSSSSGGKPGNILRVNPDGSAVEISKANGLSDFNISQIAFSEYIQRLIIVYQNGNIDLLDREGNVININSIQISNIQGSKGANHIMLYKNNCYMSFDFGIVIFNLDKFEVRETIFNISSKSSTNKVFSTAILNDSIYAASEQGLFVSKIDANINLMDVENWTELGNSPIKDIKVFNFGMVVFNNKLIIANNENGINVLINNNWEKLFDISLSGFVKDLRVSNGKLLLTSDYLSLSSIDGKDFKIELQPNKTLFRSSLYDKLGKLWITSEDGLGYLQNNKFQKFQFKSPFNSSSFKAYYNKTLDEMVVVSGAYDNGYNQTDNSNGMYVFKNGEWFNFRVADNPKFSSKIFIDMVDVLYDSLSSCYHVASFGFGLLTFNPQDTNRAWTKPEDSPFKFYDTLNSTMGNAFNPGLGGMRTNALMLEKDTLWIATHVAGRNPHSLHQFLNRANRKVWKTNNIPGVNAFQIVNDSSNFKWFRNDERLAPSPVLVYNPSNGRTTPLSFSYFSGNTSSTAASKIYCLELDGKGQLWVGTDKGIAIVTQPEQIFDRPNSEKAFRPIFDGFPLLYTEQITCIQTDGANRKWVGTNNGVWLLNEDGSEVIDRFNTENSPLPSNKIIDIEIMGSTGEVFFCTEFGLVSYRGTATLPISESTQITTFPNPVPPNYGGVISFKGFPANDSEVKITDELGTLVFEGRSNGGSFVWNGSSYSGKKAKSGVYLIFSSDIKTNKNLMGKFAIVE